MSALPVAWIAAVRPREGGGFNERDEKRKAGRKAANLT
jgi:hypothetical protein